MGINRQNRYCNPRFGALSHFFEGINRQNPIYEKKLFLWILVLNRRVKATKKTGNSV